MKKLRDRAFINNQKDTVSLELFEDSAGAFHLILKAARIRKTEEPRFLGMTSVVLNVNTMTNEVVVKEIPNRRSADIEFHLERAMNNDPEFNMSQFQQWLTVSTKNEEEGK